MPKIILNSKNFFHNLDFLSTQTNAKLALVLKDNAYGHGLKEIASLAQAYGIKNVFVKNVLEAQSISDMFENISILYGAPGKDCPRNFCFVLHSLATLESAPKCRIELKVNVGMHRNGIEISQLERAFEIIASRKLELCGVIGHSGAPREIEHNFYTDRNQFDLVVLRVASLCDKFGLDLPRFSLLNSRGIFRTKRHYDLVRIGIACYGYCDFSHVQRELKPVLTLKASKISEHQISSNDRVGYDGLGRIGGLGSVASYDIGYGDGMPYSLKSMDLDGGLVILPPVSMDCISVTSAVCNSHSLPDEIEIFSNARKFSSNVYDALVKLSPFLDREII